MIGFAIVLTPEILILIVWLLLGIWLARREEKIKEEDARKRAEQEPKDYWDQNT